MRTAEEIIEEVEMFLQVNFPQIEMHGGSFDVESFEDGEISIVLSDACSGCGISPMTIQALNNRLPSKIPEVETVDARIEGQVDPTDGPF